MVNLSTIDRGEGFSSFRAPDASLAVVMVHGDLTVERAQGLAAQIEQEAAAAEGRLAIAVVVLADVPTPPREARKQLSRALGQLERRCLALACVVEGDGIAKAAMRSIWSSTISMARVRCPVKMAGSVSEGAAWLAEQRAEQKLETDADELAALLDEAHERCLTTLRAQALSGS